MRLQRTGFMLILSALCAVSSATRAADQTPITQYLDSQTLLAAQLDLSKIDTAALQTMINQILTDQHVPITDELRQGMDRSRSAVDAMLARFKALGGKQVYVLISFPDLWPAMQPAAILIPVSAGGDPQGMETFLNNLPLNQFFSSGPANVIVTKPLKNNLLFVGLPAALHHLETLHAQPRLDLDVPLAESTSALTVVAIPTPDMRRVIAEMMPRLPEAMGNVSTESLATHLADVTLRVDLPPKPEFTLTAHTGPSEEAARLLADLTTRGLDALQQQSGFQQAFGPGGSESAIAPQVQSLLHALQPQVSSFSTGSFLTDSATVHLSSDQLRTAASLLMPALSNAREQAASVQSMSNLRQIAMACIMYRIDKKQSWPAALEDLKIYVGSDQTFINPNDPSHRRYILVTWTAAEIKTLTEKASETPIAYEAGDESRPFFNVAYMDGHVEKQSAPIFAAQLAKCRATVKK